MPLFSRTQPASVVVVVALVAWALNVAWEFAQMPLYSAAANAPGHVWMCLRASFFDAGYIMLVYVVLAVFHRSMSWVRRITVVDATAVVVFGLIVASVIEWRALATGRWSYGPEMPLVWGVGLTPLVQLALLSLVTFSVVGRWLAVPPHPIRGGSAEQGAGSTE